MSKIEFIAQENDIGRTLFKYLCRMLENIPISKIEKVFRNKDIKVNGKRNLPKNYEIKFKDRIEIYGVDNIKIKKQEFQIKINFEIVFENEDLLIVNKKNKTVMHTETNSLNNQVLSYLNFKKNDSFVPSNIGRLDKETSGLVVYAKNYATLLELQKKQKDFEKIYTFIPSCNLDKREYIIEQNVTKDEKNQKMKISKKGKNTKTIFYFDFNEDKWFAKILTGRKHQIRLIISEKLFCPILGEKKYIKKASFFNNKDILYLHSYKIIFHNLDTKWDYLNEMIFEAKIPWNRVKINKIIR